jgi:hypothetical protein
MSKLTLVASLFSLLALGISSCGTSPSPRLYLIEPTAVSKQDLADREITVGVGPIELAKYFNRKEILTHDSLYRVNAAEFDRWAEPLEHNITEALCENLSRLVPTQGVLAYPWDGWSAVDYAVSIRIPAFGLHPSGEIVLKALWVIHDASGNLIELRKSSYSEPYSGDDVVSMVSVMSRMLELLSRDIAKSINSASAETASDIETLNDD